MAHQPATPFGAGMRARARAIRPWKWTPMKTSRGSARRRRPREVCFLPYKDTRLAKYFYQARIPGDYGASPPSSGWSPRRNLVREKHLRSHRDTLGRPRSLPRCAPCRRWAHSEHAMSDPTCRLHDWQGTGWFGRRRPPSRGCSHS